MSGVAAIGTWAIGVWDFPDASFCNFIFFSLKVLLYIMTRYSFTEIRILESSLCVILEIWGALSCESLRFLSPTGFVLKILLDSLCIGKKCNVFIHIWVFILEFTCSLISAIDECRKWQSVMCSWVIERPSVNDYHGHWCFNNSSRSFYRPPIGHHSCEGSLGSDVWIHLNQLYIFAREIN